MLSDEEKILTKKLRYCEQEYEQDGYLSVGKFEAIKEAANLIEKQSKEIEELSKLKDKLVKEYEAAQEGFIKKQIPTSVVDGTIVQEVGWILNEIDKILKKAESISYKVERKD